MSNVSLNFSQASADKPKKKVELPNAEEMCDYLLHQKQRELRQVSPEGRAKLLPQMNIDDGGFRRLAVTREDFERLLAPWKRALSDLMLTMPRNKGESLSDYRMRLTQSDGDGRWWNRLYSMANLLAHIHRIDEEERAERQRQLDEEAQRKREEEERRRDEARQARERAERQATVDQREVKRLLAVIAEAKDIEALLALRDKADAARSALTRIYREEREGCEHLGKPVPEREVPGWPNALDVVEPFVDRHNPYLDVPKAPRPAAPALRTSRS